MKDFRGELFDCPVKLEDAPGGAVFDVEKNF